MAGEVAIGLVDQRRRQERHDQPTGGELCGARRRPGAGGQPARKHPTVVQKVDISPQSAAFAHADADPQHRADGLMVGLGQWRDRRPVPFVDPDWIDEDVGPFGAERLGRPTQSRSDPANGVREGDLDAQNL